MLTTTTNKLGLSCAKLRPAKASYLLAFGMLTYEWVCRDGWLVGSTGKNPNSSPLELYHKRENRKNVGFLQLQNEKNSWVWVGGWVNGCVGMGGWLDQLVRILTHYRMSFIPKASKL